jgi:hypothetical protein
VFRVHSNLYADWRVQSGLVPILREEQDAPAERLLQAVWFHQRLRRDDLRALDGRLLRVLHPGFWNREAGPDFHGAVVQFEGEAPRVGDVEVDVQSSGWRLHGHHTNPNFENVVLHVVWDGDATPSLPTLALKSVLDSPIGELGLWLGSDAAKSFPVELLGQCCAPLGDLSQERLTELLRQAAFIRLQAKAGQLQARARQAGWEQALWEGLFRALGYKQNVWPMQRLGELSGRICPVGARFPSLAVQARLLGAGGLLPAEVKDAPPRTAKYVRALWDLWWRSGIFPRLRVAAFAVEIQQPASRQSSPTPAGSRRKLAGRRKDTCVGGEMVHANDCGSRVERLAFEILQASGDEFWSKHWTLRSNTFTPAQPLLGASRVTDLAVNVILPWLWCGRSKAKRSAA